jgi:hypothetical protein
MFSPAVKEAVGPAGGTRSRRRQRPKSTDSLVQPPKAKRQRLPLTEATFVNPEPRPEMFEVKADKVAMLEVKQDGLENMPPPRKELSVRAKKPKASERAGKGDGSVVLVSVGLGSREDAFSSVAGPVVTNGTRQRAMVFPSAGFQRFQIGYATMPQVCRRPYLRPVLTWLTLPRSPSWRSLLIQRICTDVDPYACYGVAIHNTESRARDFHIHPPIPIKELVGAASARLSRFPIGLVE